MLVHDGGDLIAGVVFHDYSPESGVIEMSAAAESRRWLTRPVMKAMHSYVFDDAGCQMAILIVAESNKTMRRIAKAYGYTETLIPRLRGRNEGGAVMTLTDDAWRASRFHR